MDLRPRKRTVLTADLNWDVDGFDLSPDGKTIAFITNEDGVGKIHLIDARSGRKLRGPELPLGIPSGVTWHENGRDLAFSFNSAKSPTDAYSYDVKTRKLERWTESETGGLNTTSFIEPELIRVKSFDGLQVSGFLYRPDAKKFPGKRPIIVSIHGGPESQSRPDLSGAEQLLFERTGRGDSIPERARVEWLRENFPDARQRFQARGFSEGHRRVSGLDREGCQRGCGTHRGDGRELWRLHDAGEPRAFR
jgi:WD40 repeat protein